MRLRSTDPTRRLAAAVALTALALTGCSAAQDAASSAKDAAVDSASEAASQAVRDAVQDQICAVLGDGTVSGSDLDTLGTALDSADGLGLPAELLDPARAVLAQGQDAADSLAAVQKECAAG